MCLLVCRLSSGSACNIHGTNNCSTTLCNCKIEYEGYLCEKCNWHEFSFVSHGIEGVIDPISGYGVSCKKGISIVSKLKVRLNGCIWNSNDIFCLI